MRKTVTTKYIIREPHSEGADKGLFTGMFEGIITFEDEEFSNVSLSDEYALPLPIIHFHSPEMLKEFARFFCKVLKQLDKLDIIDYTEICDFLNCP